MVEPWMVEEVDRKLVVTCDVVSNWLQIITILNSQITALLATIKLKILTLKQINLITSFYLEISNYSHSILLKN